MTEKALSAASWAKHKKVSSFAPHAGHDSAPSPPPVTHKNLRTEGQRAVAGLDFPSRFTPAGRSPSSQRYRILKPLRRTAMRAVCRYWARCCEKLGESSLSRGPRRY